MVIKKCYIFTPKHIVDKMLDEAQYIDKLYGKKFLENSCGEGNILCEAVVRYIKNCLKENRSKQEIKLGLERDFMGIEYDAVNQNKCIENLNKIAEKYKLDNVRWNIILGDYLKIKINKKFDYIVGNPPYISYREINIENRKFIRSTFNSCKKGKFDYYYPFIEKSLNSLKEHGILVYLIPTNFFKNVFAHDLREYIKKSICTVFDYTTEKIFKNILTSSSIMICNLEKNNSVLKYIDVSKNKSYYLNKEELGEKWIFRDNGIKEKVLFSEYFSAAASIATLLNRAFVIKEYEKLNNYYRVSNFIIEEAVVKKAASPRSYSKNKKEMIIFPYYIKDEKIVRYDSKEFSSLFPGASEYLNIFRTELENRAISKSVMWFEYGRTQAIDKMNKKKLMISSIVTDRVNVYELDENTIPYSGIYIVMKSEKDLKYAKEILTSDEFYEYVKCIGTHVSGVSIRITANDIKKFDISKWSLKWD